MKKHGRLSQALYIIMMQIIIATQVRLKINLLYLFLYNIAVVYAENKRVNFNF